MMMMTRGLSLGALAPCQVVQILPGRVKILSCSLLTSTQQQLRSRSGAPANLRRRNWRRNVVTSTLNTSGSSSGGGGPVENEGFSLGSTRLGRLVSERRRELLQRWNIVRKNFPAKIFLLLFGFFSANALATILGQTGDWDVIAAGILVAMIEGIGHLMYRMPVFLEEQGKKFVELVNYWKIGFVFALFVDAFKVGS